MPTSSRLAALVLVAALPLAACSSNGGGGGGSASPTGGSSTSQPTPSPTSASPSDSSTTSPSPSDSTTPPRPDNNPSTVPPSPLPGMKGVTVVYTPTTAQKGERISILATTDPSLAGKPVYIVKMNDGAPRVISTGSTVGSAGVAKTFAMLQRTGVLKLVIPAQPFTAAPDSTGSYPFDPTAPLLAESSEFTVTIV